MVNSKKDDLNSIKSDKQTKDNALVDGNWHLGKIFWGLFLVIIGGLALASNFGIVQVDFSNIWRLWPLMIVAAGLSVLSLRSVIGRIIVIIAGLLTLAAVVWVVMGNFSTTFPVHAYDLTVKKISDKVKQVEFSVKAGASDLRIGSVEQNSLAKSKLESNASTVSETSNIVGDTQLANLSMDMRKNNNWFIGDISNTWTINLNRSLPLGLNVDTGASNADIDMSAAQLRTLNIKAGASSLVVKIGDREDNVDVSIESGVSSVDLKVPSGVGVQVRLDNGLTDNHLSDLVKVSENLYESAGYDQSAKKINVNTKIGVSTFKLVRY